MSLNYEDVAVGKGATKYGSKNAQSDYAKRAKGTTYTPTKKTEGGNQFVDFFKKLGTDINREVYNFLGDWSPGGNVWTNKPMVSGGGLGDLMEGSREDAWFPQKGLEKPDTGTGTDDSRSMQDILGEIMGLMGGGGGGGYGALRGELESQRDRNDARLEAMYRQVADYINALRPQAEQTYAKAAEGYNTAQQQAANAVNMGVDVARQQQANMLKALGIEEAANVASARGEDMGTGQTAALNKFADLLNANLNRNTGAQTEALSGLQNLSTATMGEGARARQAYQEAMAQKLAELSASETQYNNQRSDAALKMAMDIMGSQSGTPDTDKMSSMFDSWVKAARDGGYNASEAIDIANSKMNAWKAANGL